MNIKFLNHASILIETEDYQILVDPWFSGKIFNNSWSLLRETDRSQIDFHKLKYVVVSHEHPDHFHIPTLKEISSKSSNKVKFVFPERNNKNVQEFVEKNGMEYVQINEFIKDELEENFKLTPVRQGDDSALILQIEGETVFHQNDAYLSDDKVKWIQENFPVVDYWFFQFSLAGFYGNRSNPSEIRKQGTEFHIDCFKKYQSLFAPKVSIPFASFVYFCKEHNDYINDFAVDLEELKLACDDSLRVMFYGDNVNSEKPIRVEQSNNNIKKWKKCFEQERIITPSAEISDEEIILAAQNSIKESRKYGFPQPAAICLELYDDERLFVIDYRGGGCGFVEKTAATQDFIAGILPREELKFFFDFPWGADTLNITGCFEIYNLNTWRALLTYKDALYIR